MTAAIATRREFLAAGAAAMAAARCGAAQAASNRNTICVFTKPFQSLAYDDFAAKIAELGCDGVEATIRDQGHIEPARVEDELPKMAAALKSKGLEITVMASSINDPRDPLTERVLKTAAELGVKRYRMKYFRYDPQRDIRKQIRGWQPQLRELAAMNRELGMQAVYQNHAGATNLGAAIWDLAELLDGVAPQDVAVAYDIRHATVEGGQSWPTTFRMIRPHIGAVYVKDFQWTEGKPKNVPLGQGQVSPRFFQQLRESDFTGPISLHEEYLDHRDPKLVPQHLAAIKTDLATLRKLLGS